MKEEPPIDLKESIRLKELSIREKELDEREELRFKASMNELELIQLEVRAIEENMDFAHFVSFDVSKHIRLVPLFVEKEVEKYFEKVALTLKCPKEIRTLLKKKHAAKGCGLSKTVSKSAVLRPELPCDMKTGYKPFLSNGFVSLSGEKPQCFFFQDGVLIRKWRPYNVPDQWNSVQQIVVPSVYRDEILCVAHDGVAGHLGVAKPLNRICQQFYWPGVKQDVVRLCKTCKICQLVGKPNHAIPPATLYPIPVIGQPFDHVIVDIVGPLVRSRNGYEYMLKMMCVYTFPRGCSSKKNQC